MVLIAELHRVGMFDGSNLDMMALRLDLSDEPDLAERVRAIPVSNFLTDPEEVRAGLHLVSGGNEDEG